MIQLEDIQTAYFIGIGGIGMSAIARFLCENGVQVSGYDRTATTLTQQLEAEGIAIHYQEDIGAIPENLDVVVYTPAIPSTHSELVYLQASSIPVMKRSGFLGILSQSRRTIAVAGTHGKTTTCSILIHMLKSGSIDATAFLGGLAVNYQTNYVSGKSDWVVIEADEFDRSFLTLTPEKALILSTDPDHLDIYGDASTMIDEGYAAFMDRVSAGGTLGIKTGLPVWKKAEAAWEENQEITVYSYGLQQGDYHATNIRVDEGYFGFDLVWPGGLLKNVSTSLPGRHNIENAVAAASIALQLGVSEEAIRAALLSFKGIKRRFERIFENDTIVYIDDYAHHPSELQAVIQAARELFPNRHLTGIFQPHLYSRTSDFAKGFAAALDQLDRAILLEIYPAREEPIPGISSAIIFELMHCTDKVQVQKKEELLPYLAQQNKDVLLTMGAGDIDTLVEPIKTLLAT